ncbi:hypothetical protein B0H13DRAFT_1513572, partial [Mycena leptocephala]
LCDGWRQAFPHDKGYSLLQKSTGSQSRIDRILVPTQSLGYLKNWSIEPTGIFTDHQMVSVEYANPKSPFIGRGRWCLPLHILKDTDTMDKIKEIRKEIESAMEACKFRRSDSNNVQILFKSFKDQLIKICRDRAKIMIPLLRKLM